MGGFEAGEWEIREKDWAVYKELDQFSVNYFLLRGAEEEKAMVRDEMEGVIHLSKSMIFTGSDSLTNYSIFGNLCRRMKI